MTALARFARTWPMLSALGAGLVLLALAAGATGVAGIALAAVGIAGLGWGVLSLRAGTALVPPAVLGVSAALLGGAGAFIGVGLAESTDVAVGPLVAASVFTAVVGGHSALLVRRSASVARVAGLARPTSDDVTRPTSDTVAGDVTPIAPAASPVAVAAGPAPTARPVGAALAAPSARPRLAALLSAPARAFADRSADAVADHTSLAGLVAGALLVAALATPALAATEPGELAVPHGDQHGGSISVTDADPGEDGHRH